MLDFTLSLQPLKPVMFDLSINNIAYMYQLTFQFFEKKTHLILCSGFLLKNSYLEDQLGRPSI